MMEVWQISEKMQVWKPITVAVLEGAEEEEEDN